MTDSDSEYYVQVFLFVATILCYLILGICIFYGIYYCCLQACILRAKRRHQANQSLNEEGFGDQEAEIAYRGLRSVKVLYPFQGDGKNAITSPNSNTSKNIPTTQTNCELADNTISDNIVISSILDERNPFVDKKYYDIFVE